MLEVCTSKMLQTIAKMLQVIAKNKSSKSQEAAPFLILRSKRHSKIHTRIKEIFKGEHWTFPYSFLNASDINGFRTASGTNFLSEYSYQNIPIRLAELLNQMKAQWSQKLHQRAFIVDKVWNPHTKYSTISTMEVAS